MCKDVEMDKPPLGYLKNHQPDIICYLVDYPAVDQWFVDIYFPINDIDEFKTEDGEVTELSRPKDFYCAMVDQMLYIDIYSADNQKKNTLQGLLKKVK